MLSKVNKPLWQVPGHSRVTHVNFLPANASPIAENIEHLPVEQILAACGMEAWSHTLWSSSSIEIDPLWEDISAESVLTEAKLALTPMPAGLSGLEVIAIDFIPRGSRLLYAGLKCELDSHDPYAAGDSAAASCSARRHGNISRFMSHAFKQDSLDENIKFLSRDIQSTVALSNFDGVSYKSEYSKHGLTCIVATRDIQPGECVRWDYGLEHFDALDIAPVLFSHDNLTVDCSGYYYTNTELAVVFRDGSICFPIKEIIEESHIIFIASETSSLGYDLYLDSEYISQLIMANPQILSKRIIEVDLPDHACEHVKYYIPNSISDINLHLWRYAQSVMTELDTDTPYTLQCMPVDVSEERPHQPRRRGDAYYEVRGDIISLETKRAKLELLGIEVCGKMTDDPISYFLWIKQKSLFKHLTSELLADLECTNKSCKP